MIKKLLGILVLGLLWCEISLAKDFMIHKGSDGYRTIWNLKDAKEIGMLQYEVKQTTRPGKERLIYNNKIIRELFNYCDKPIGKYESTPAMLYLGETDRPDQGVKVYLDDENDPNSKGVIYWIPYYRFLNSWDIAENYKRGDLNLTCKFKIKNSEKYHSRKYMINVYLDLKNQDSNNLYYFDCDRMMSDMTLSLTPYRKVRWQIPNKGTVAESWIIKGCSYLEEVMKARNKQ